MKKQYLAVAFLAVALGITACSSKKADTESTTAQEVESTEATSDEEVEEDYYYGFVSLVEDNVITVSEDGGNTAKFDISDAEITGADEIGEGDEVIVGFAGELSSDVTITLKTEEGTYTLNALIAQKVTKDGIKAGAEAEVTYYGDLEDPDDAAVATRIVTADAKDTEEAKKKTLTGTVAEVEADHIVLATADPENTLFSFVGTEGMFDGISVGDKVTVIYDGTLTDKTVAAQGVE